MIEAKLKTCATCLHMHRRSPGELSSDWRCTSPKAHRLDPVTGQPIAWFCTAQRVGMDGGVCGRDGVYWEAVAAAEEESK